MSQNPTAPRNPMSASNATAPKAAPSSGPGSGPTAFGRPGGDDDFVINLDGAELTSRNVVPGDYYAYVSAIEKTMSKAGNPMIVWDITLYGGEYEGKTFKVYTALTPEAMWKFVECCQAVAYPFPEDNRPKLGDVKRHALRTIVIARFVEGEYNGRPKSEISNLMPHDVEPGKKLPGSGVPTA